MIQQIVGTINKRIDVGVMKHNLSNSIFIHASSNCIEFNEEEMESLLSVLSILANIQLDDAIEWFYKHRIRLFDPAPPPAEIRII